MRYITPITDRELLDITNRTSKAFLNIADWIRIYNNAELTKILVDFLLGTSTTFDAVSTPTVFTKPTVTQLNTLLANMNRVRIASGLPEITGLSELKADWLEGSSADAPDYIDVNAWETFIDTIFNCIGLSMEYRIYCGVSATGQPRFYQYRFRQYSGWVQPAVSPHRRARTGFAVCGSGLRQTNKYRRY